MLPNASTRLELVDSLAQDTPGKLIQRGNELLKYIARKPLPLTAKDLKELDDLFDEEPDAG